MRTIVWDQNAVEGEFTFANEVHNNLLSIYENLTSEIGPGRVIITPVFYTLLGSAAGGKGFLTSKADSDKPSDSGIYDLGKDIFHNTVLLDAYGRGSRAVFLAESEVVEITTVNESFI